MKIMVTTMYGAAPPKGGFPKPVTKFEHAFGNYPELLEEVRKQGFIEPTPIQCQAWPVIMSGHDLIGIAQTGSGKTLAFLLPILVHIDKQTLPRKQRAGPSCMILAPTRELAQQIDSEVRKISYKGIKSLCVYGGSSKRQQIEDYRNTHCDIVIATPGRLIDLIACDVINVEDVSILVLDEADRMLDTGFYGEIRRCVSGIRKDRQSIMTSATWASESDKLVFFCMKNPIEVVIGSYDLTAVHSVKQKVFLTSGDEKRKMLYTFLRMLGPDDKVIIFTGSKAMTDMISSDLALFNIDCQSIHGNRDQCDREQALLDFKGSEVKILVATDVASRGIDISDVTHIFNYDFPRAMEEYIHRVGRTGRAGRSGESVTLMTTGDKRHFQEILRILQEANQLVPFWLDKKIKYQEENPVEERQNGRGWGRGGGGGSRGGFGGRRGGGQFRRNF